MAQTKQRNELIALGALVLSAAVIWYAYYGRTAKPKSGIAANGQYTEIDAQDYGRFIVDLDKTQKTEYKSTGRNIFVIGPMPVEQAKQGPVKEPWRNVGPMPPLPPPPAQLPMVFFGYGMLPAGGPRQAFLKEENGDEVHIVSEGDLVLNHIRILHIGNERLDFEDINTGQKGSKTLEAPAPQAAS
ncbi:MAG TPA: hypothetical protein VLX60_15270 [Terriglobales bacterium]|nr:hypothetical protein [Terriglobales bacterium]